MKLPLTFIACATLTLLEAFPPVDLTSIAVVRYPPASLGDFFQRGESVQLGTWSEAENQTLTLVFAGTRPSENLCGETFEEHLESDLTEGVTQVRGWRAGDLKRCLTRPAPGWSALFARDRTDDAENLSLLQSRFVTGVDVEVSGDVAGGIVQVDRPGCFTQAIPFSMRKTEQGWRVESFDLLDTGWKVERGEDDWWVGRRVDEVPPLPDLQNYAEYAEVRLRSEWGQHVVEVNREAVKFDELHRSVADEIVVLRVEGDVTGDQFRSLIDSLQSVQPPVRALFTISTRMIDNCLCLIGFGMGAEAPTPVERLLDDDSLASPFVDVPRTMLPRESVTMCVGAEGISMECPGGLKISASESVRYLVETAIDAVDQWPYLPVLISVGPDARYSQVDQALDIAVRSETPYVYLATGPDKGIVFEIRHEVRRSPCSPRTRNNPVAKKPVIDKDVETKVVSPSTPATGEPIRFVVNGPVTEPVKIDGQDAIYPDAAKRAHIQGVVVLEAVIGPDGNVENLTTLRGLPLGLTEAAVQAVRRWRYEPATMGGEPVPVKYIITVRFTLQ